MPTDFPWWQTAVIYQVYPRSFQDTNGDGIGDLAGILSRLDYLAELGVDAVWISPIYPSPMADFGYDVSDYTGIDPIFGTLADFDRLIARAHALGLRVILDFVPNHTSSQHPWFIESRSSFTNEHREWYIWHDPEPGDGPPESRPPNNWLSHFGGSAWTYDETAGQFYLHSFLPEQPDLNWRNQYVRKAIYDAMLFWLERGPNDNGVDGFRMDVLWLLIKDELFRDNPPNPEWQSGGSPFGRFLPLYTADRPETHEIVAEMRTLLEIYSTSPADERLPHRRDLSPYPRARSLLRLVRAISNHQPARSDQRRAYQSGTYRCAASVQLPSYPDAVAHLHHRAAYSRLRGCATF